jgi:hypothetical protein
MIQDLFLFIGDRDVKIAPRRHTCNGLGQTVFIFPFVQGSNEIDSLTESLTESVIR